MSRSRRRDDDRPLITQSQERTAEIHARIISIERACRIIGYESGSSYERLAAMIAKTCGHEVLTRSLTAIAGDRDIGFSDRQTKRAIEDLIDVGILESLSPPASKFRQRGRPKRVYALRIRWEFVREVVASSHGRNTPSDYSASSRRDVGVESASSRHQVGVSPASSRHLENHTALFSQAPNPHGSPAPAMSDSTEKQEDHGCVALASAVDPPPGPSVSRTHRFSADDVAATAARLFVGLGYFGDNATTLWMVAAAFDAGLIAEADIADSVRGAYECVSAGQRVAYFRTCLANRLGLDAAGMRSLLSRSVIAGGAPSGPPRAALEASQRRAGRKSREIGRDNVGGSERELSRQSQKVLDQLAKAMLA